MAKITLKNIGQFVEGNLNVILDDLGGKPDYYKEQIVYRATKCNDCFAEGGCKYCGCSLPGKHHVKESCNKGERFPDLMCKTDWEQYKRDNNIQIDL